MVDKKAILAVLTQIEDSDLLRGPGKRKEIQMEYVLSHLGKQEAAEGRQKKKAQIVIRRMKRKNKNKRQIQNRARKEKIRLMRIKVE